MASWPGVIRLTVRFTRTLGDDMISVIHTRRDDEAPPQAVHLLEAAQTYRDALWDAAAVTTDLRQYTANEVTLADILAVSMDATNIGLFQLLAVNQAGSSLQDLLNPQLAAVASHRTAIAARSARGRTYHGGLTALAAPVSNSAYPSLTSTFLADLATMWTRFDTTLAALTTPQSHVIASVADQVARDVVSRRFPTKLYTQRRRN